MKLKIEIELDNSAFEPEYRKIELNRIMNDLVDEIYYVSSAKKNIRDSNGNTVGTFSLTK